VIPDYRRTALAVFLIWASAPVVAALPAVYGDAHVVVHAAVVEAGSEPMHIGDSLTLAVEIAFDREQVQVEAPDSDWFQRAFSSLPGVRLYRSDPMTRMTDAAGHARLAMRWHFQIVDCPAPMANCPGLKAYDLPVMTIAYRVSGGAAGTEAARSARFTPWPGTITLVPAIAFEAGDEADLAAVLPGGAWPEPKHTGGAAAAGPVLLATGGLLLAGGFVVGKHRRRRPRAAPRRHQPVSRFERAAVRLQQSDLSDEEWSDLLRRCVTWFCVDELSLNPLDWLREDASHATRDDGRTAACRALFLDVLAETGVERGRRDAYLERFHAVTGGLAASGGMAAPP
jgi:hypothetical protein